MPELPEVESFARSLQSHYAGKTLSGIVMRRDDVRFPLEKQKLRKIFAEGAVLKRIWREGKQLVIETSQGSVNVSLGMTGHFTSSELKHPKPHEHITLLFQSEKKALGFVDARRFGFWKVREGAQAESIVNPLDAEKLLSFFLSDATQRTRSVKEFICDQKHIGGIGNIYALEALFEAKVHPMTRCQDVSRHQWKILAESLPKILQVAIERGGSSIATYRTLNGDKGGFQDLHRVYDREGETCPRPRCKGKIERIVQSGRSSWFCPHCQRLG